MRKLFIAMLLLSSSAFAAVPVSQSIGRIQCEIPSGSVTEIALAAVSEEYTEAWLDEYAVDKITFGEAYSEILSSALPMTNVIAGSERNGAVTLKSLDNGTVLSFIFRNGRIVAISQSP